MTIGPPATDERETARPLPTDEPYSPSRPIAALSLAAIVVLAVLLRLPDMEGGIWNDEAATWWQVSGSLPEMLVRTAGDNYPPLYNLLLWPLVHTLGKAEWVLRLPALLLGIAAVPMLYLLGSRVGGRIAGLLAAALLALSPFHIMYSADARMYSLLAFAAVAHAWAALRWSDPEASHRRLFLVLTGCILLYSHPFGALTWAAIGIGALIVGVNRAAFVASSAITLAVFSVWGVVLLMRAAEVTSKGFWIPFPTLDIVGHQLRRVVGTAWPALLLLGLIALWRPPAAAQRWRPMLLLWLLLPTLVALLASVLLTPVFLDRYLIGSLPALLLLAALGLSGWVRGPVTAGVAGLAVLAIGAVSISNPPYFWRPDWRSAIAAAKVLEPQPACTFYLPDGGQRLLSYYDAAECVAPLEELAAFSAANPTAPLVAILDASRAEWETLPDNLPPTLRLVSEQRFRDIALFHLAPATGP